MMYYFKIEVFASYIVRAVHLKVRVNEKERYISKIITCF
jgi:hypothetical protein